MKTKFYLMIVVLFIAFSSQAQPKPPIGPNVTMDGSGNYREKTDQATGRLYIDKNGKSFPVFISRTGKLYAITGISKKTGKPIRKYIKP